MEINEEQKKKIVEIMREEKAALGYLFGSVARGTAGPLSDIDVAVVFPFSFGEEERFKRIEKIRGSVEHIYGIDKVDVVDLNKLRNPALMHEIVLDEGALLFNDDQNLKNYLSLKALRDFEDTQPIRNIQSVALKEMFNVN